MTCTLVSILLILTGQAGPFEEHLPLRRFEEAMLHADGSDSLTAVVFEAAGDNASAARLFGRAFRNRPSAGLLADLWRVLAADIEHYPELAAGELRSDISVWDSVLQWNPETLLSLSLSAASLGDSLLSDSLGSVLLSRFPYSDEAINTVGWEFWDTLYPVWYDDSARVDVLREFIAERGGGSDLWRSTAWRYLISASSSTADSTLWEEQLQDWFLSCPGDPQGYLTGAILYMTRDSAFSVAAEMADAGLALMEGGWRPAGMPPEEWEITGSALGANLLFRRCQALLFEGRTEEALDGILEISRSGLFGVDDHHTRAPYLFLEGRASVALGDTTSAMNAWLEACVLGDERNTWTDSALVLLSTHLPRDITPPAWGRAALGYTGPVFSEVTGLLGPDSLVGGSRVSWCDWNMDGWPDLLLGADLYRNDSGTGFTPVMREAFADTNHGNGGIWGDIDRNGWPDLVTSGDPVQVFLNEDGTLRDRTDELGLEPTESRVEGVAILDWDADGWLDIYLASYEKPGGMAEGTSDQFWLGGEGGFREVSDSLGMEPFLGVDLCGRGVSPCDFDRDGDMDIFVSNYRLGENFLWENEPGGARNNALVLGIAGHETDGWWGHTIGSAWGDINNDGSWELFSANLAHPRYIPFSDRSELLVGSGDEFSDRRAVSGVFFEETHSNPVWGDFNNDGLLDLYITSIYENRRSFLYISSGIDPVSFTEAGFLSEARVFNGWGAAAADFDRDGALDLAVGSGSGPVLLRNMGGTGGNWLLVQVLPPEGTNPSGLGCVVEVVQDGRTYLRQVSGGSGTSSQDDAVLHFGLPSESPVELRLYIPGDPSPVWVSSGVSTGTLVTAGP